MLVQNIDFKLVWPPILIVGATACRMVNGTFAGIGYRCLLALMIERATARRFGVILIGAHDLLMMGKNKAEI